MTTVDSISQECKHYSAILGHLASNTVDFVEGLRDFSARYKATSSAKDLKEIARELSNYQNTLFNQYKQCIVDAREYEGEPSSERRVFTGIDELRDETIQNIFLHMRTVFAVYSSLSGKINHKILIVEKHD